MGMNPAEALLALADIAQSAGPNHPLLRPMRFDEALATLSAHLAEPPPAHPSILDCSHVAASAYDFTRSLESHIGVGYFDYKPSLRETAAQAVEDRDERMRRQGELRVALNTTAPAPVDIRFPFLPCKTCCPNWWLNNGHRMLRDIERLDAMDTSCICDPSAAETPLVAPAGCGKHLDHRSGISTVDPGCHDCAPPKSRGQVCPHCFCNDCARKALEGYEF